MRIVVSENIPSRVVYHGGPLAVEHPEIRKAKYFKDFGFGFYCTMLREQAVRWATRYADSGWLSYYDYLPTSELKTLVFPEMSDRWLDFVVDCRSGKAHDYDIVEGPMADDAIYNYVQDFIDGKISRAAFWELAKFRYPTHQVSFHTSLALATLKFMKSEEVHDA